VAAHTDMDVIFTSTSWSNRVLTLVHPLMELKHSGGFGLHSMKEVLEGYCCVQACFTADTCQWKSRAQWKG